MQIKCQAEACSPAWQCYKFVELANRQERERQLERVAEARRGLRKDSVHALAPSVCALFLLALHIC